jgi:pimeloyl-ACP methyl ester carboxylesterase
VLDPFRGFDDPARGFRETFLTPQLGGGRTVAVLSTPIGALREPGWIVCHSYSYEQMNIMPLEVRLARQLAATGHAVLRYHGQGYGDSELPSTVAGARSHLQDARDAVEVLRDAAEIGSVAIAGARFGGAVAAVVGAEVGASELLLWDPVIRGRAYADAIVQQSILSQLAAKDAEQREDPLSTLRERGWADVQGFPVTREAFDDIRALEVPDLVGAFSGRALVVQISRTEKPRPDVARLVAALTSGAGRVELATLAPAKNERPLGAPRFKGNGDGTKTDTQQQLEEGLISASMRWVSGEVAANADGVEPS